MNPSRADTVRIVAIGDVVVNRPNPSETFEHVRSLFQDADIAFCNLEAPLCDASLERTPFVRVVPIRADRPMVAAIESAGFHIVSLANTHATDYGMEGLLQTMETLEEHGIRYVGAGRTLAEARRPVILERNGVRIAFLAYLSHYQFHSRASAKGPGVTTVRVAPLLPPPHVFPEELEAMQDDVSAARAAADIVIVACHWGESFTRLLAAHQPVIGHAAVEAGADLVVGHHPHTLQAVEVYRGKAIFYSLGNFVFDFGLPMSSDTIAVNCDVQDRAIRRVAFRPILGSQDGQPVLPPVGNERALAILATMERLSRERGTELAIGEDGVANVIGPVLAGSRRET